MQNKLNISMLFALLLSACTGGAPSYSPAPQVAAPADQPAAAAPAATSSVNYTANNMAVSATSTTDFLYLANPGVLYEDSFKINASGTLPTSDVYTAIENIFKGLENQRSDLIELLTPSNMATASAQIYSDGLSYIQEKIHPLAKDYLGSSITNIDIEYYATNTGHAFVMFTYQNPMVRVHFGGAINERSGSFSPDTIIIEQNTITHAIQDGETPYELAMRYASGPGFAATYADAVAAFWRLGQPGWSPNGIESTVIPVGTEFKFNIPLGN